MAKSIKELNDYEWLNHPDCRFIERHEIIKLIRDRIKELEGELKKHALHDERTDDNFPKKPEDCDYWVEAEDSFYSYCGAYAKITGIIEELRRLLGE